jgi:hypothetical protein
LLPSLVARVGQTGLPKLYAPVATGALGGPVRFTARLTSALPWTITVTDATGTVEATGSGVGTSIDWTWDSSATVPGAAYTWVISAGSTVRTVVGVLGGKLPALTLSNLRVSPPTLDGSVVPSATVTYTLSSAATVTAELMDSLGSTTPLFVESKAAGAQTFVFTPAGLADGNYTIRLTARDAIGRLAEGTVPVAVSHAVLGFSADGKLISPNGDGRRDTVLFRFVLTQPAAATLAVVSDFASVPFFSGQLMPGSQAFAFTGTGTDGAPLRDGDYEVRLTVGGVTHTLPLTIDTTPPTISLVSVKPLQLRVTERVTVIATVNGRLIRASVRPGVFALAKHEVIRTLSVVARDAAGNESPPLTYLRM